MEEKENFKKDDKYCKSVTLTERHELHGNGNISVYPCGRKCKMVDSAHIFESNAIVCTKTGNEYTLQISSCVKPPKDYDCLYFTERVLTGKYHSRACLLYSYNSFKYIFGVTHSQNALIARHALEYNNVLQWPPSVGTALVALPAPLPASLPAPLSVNVKVVQNHKQKQRNQTHYHVVPVIARFGSEIVTLEVDSRLRNPPCFQTYMSYSDFCKRANIKHAVPCILHRAQERELQEPCKYKKQNPDAN